MAPQTDPSLTPGSTEPKPSPSGPARWAHDHGRDLERFLAKRQLIASDIKDVCQEVYLRLLRFERAEMIQNPIAYLYRVAANVAHDFRLRQSRCSPMDEAEMGSLPSESSAEDLAESYLRSRALFKALEALPALPRAALALQARDDLTHEQIAAMLGVSRRALRRAISRGHALLREALARDF